MISVAEVKVSDDLRSADIFLSFYSEKDTFDKETSFKHLYKYKNHIKYKLGKSLKLKYIPKINFKLSDDYAYYDKINRLLKNDS
tara:strand:+ start:365 stop:616 length:252 start_codon:yes stop_codon:yes gene_type:complete